MHAAPPNQLMEWCSPSDRTLLPIASMILVKSQGDLTIYTTSITFELFQSPRQFRLSLFRELLCPFSYQTCLISEPQNTALQTFARLKTAFRRMCTVSSHHERSESYSKSIGSLNRSQFLRGYASKGLPSTRGNIKQFLKVDRHPWMLSHSRQPRLRTLTLAFQLSERALRQWN